MQILFLGTGAGSPSRRRNLPSLVLRFDQGSAVWLFDCGEGTQHQMLRSPVHPGQIERVFITHLHGDHLFGLPGLLGSRSIQSGATAPVTVHGPTGIRKYLEAALSASGTRLRYELFVEEIDSEGTAVTQGPFTVSCRFLSHGVPSIGYAVREALRPGRLREKDAQRAGIPPGPLYGRLKRGEAVPLPGGGLACPKDFVDPPKPGRSVVVLGDTAPCEAAVDLARRADILVHESTFAPGDADLARRSGHSTSREAAAAALKAGVRSLILTHISARYDSPPGAADRMLAGAREVFPDTRVAEDLDAFDF